MWGEKIFLGFVNAHGGFAATGVMKTCQRRSKLQSAGSGQRPISIWRFKARL
jgi:hypothetical protein